MLSLNGQAISFEVPMRRHGWQGDLPADDDEAVRRILDAARACIDRDGDAASVSDVARELGVSRSTVYRYFRTTEDLLRATAIDASGAFLERIQAHFAGRAWTPAEAVVEGIVLTLEELPRDPYLGLLLTPGRISLFSQGFTSPISLSIGSAVLEQLSVDWSAHGFDKADLDDIAEQTLRMTQSFVIDAGTPARSGDDLRAYLHRWLGRAIVARQPAHDVGAP
jgi:AcrR family transcriptional regulator